MIIFLYGEDTFRSRQKLNELKDRFLKEVDPLGNSLLVINGADLNLEKFSEAISAPSLFAKKRMVIIENVFGNKNKNFTDQLYEYFKKEKVSTGQINDNIIIFRQDTADLNISANKLFKFLSEQKYVYNLKSLSNTEATTWVKKEVEKHGAKIKPQAALHLTSLFAGNLWQLSNEINKLINYKSGRNEQLLDGQGEIMIDVIDVEALVHGTSDENIFALTDAIGRNDKAEALRLFEQEIEAGAVEQQLLAMIQRQFKILLQVRQALDQKSTPRKIMSELKLHPFVVQKSLDQVRNFSLPTLKKIFHALINIDRQTKSGQIEFKSALSVLLAKI
jgi:DNA polymerase-3 subunit delta